MSKWTRPAAVTVPTVWSTFEGRIKINGQKRIYWIQDITDEYKDEVVNYMTQEFMADGPLCKYSKTYKVPEMKKIFKDDWYKSLKHNLGLVCLTKDEKGKPTIAAINCTTLYTQDEDEDGPNKIAHQVLQTIMFIKDQVDPFKKFNITEYLDAKGLYVLPKYRGEGLGLELLKAREPLCRACGLRVSLTLFSSIKSQKLAERAGFKDLYSIDYDELERRNPKWSYPGVQDHTKTIRFMYILYE